MHKRLVPVLVLVCTATVLVPATAFAQQTLNFSLGVFTPRGEDARVDGDVLNANRTFLFFDIKDFKSASIGGEWLVPFNEFFEGGAGIGFSEDQGVRFRICHASSGPRSLLYHPRAERG